MLFKKSFFFKIALFKYTRKTQKLSVLRGNLKQNVIFSEQIFFKIVLFKNKFSFKIVLHKNFIFFQNHAS